MSPLIPGKTYSGGGTTTSPVTYYYDQSSYNGLTISNGNGVRTGMSDGSGETAWSFDGMGRIAAIEKTINSVTKTANYTYNADGTTNTVQDFGGTTFTYSYDVSDRPTSIVDGSSNTYASSAVYNAAGQLTSLNHKLKSGGGAYQRTIQYNSRMQPSVIAATLNGTSIQSLTYGYGTGGTNNGNILSITNGIEMGFSQTYSYDYMNRLASGYEEDGWGEAYSYDNWGNLYQTTPIDGEGGNNWSVTANGNNQLSNLTYDSAGEVTKDQYSNNFSYDAEGRVLSGGSGTYVYDGAGNRVKKSVSGSTTLYWPGAGSLLDESNSTGTTMGPQVSFDGLLVWHEDISGNGLFLFHDHLGSIRVTGDASGELHDNYEYQPFGTLFINYGGHPSDNHYLFTGDESDSETTSDYAVNRNLGLTLGRFNRPDPYDGSYDQTNPQSLNRYSYALNNPLSFTDPSGLLEAPPGVGGGGGGCSGDECGAGCDDYDDCAGSGGDDCGDQCLNPTRLGIGGTGHAPVYPLTGAGLSPINWDTPLGTAWDETLGLPAGSLTSMPGAGQIIRSIMGQLGIPDLTGMNCMPICEASAPNNGQRNAGFWAKPNGGYPVPPEFEKQRCDQIAGSVKGLTFFAAANGAAALFAPVSAPITAPVGAILGVGAAGLDWFGNLTGCK